MAYNDYGFWTFFGIATAIKFLLIPTYHSTDFEVHRNWMAITHSLNHSRWYYEDTSEWTLDYPPFFAYFEYLLSKIAYYVDPGMLELTNLNYLNEKTKYFQRISVIATDVIYAWGVKRCIDVFRTSGQKSEYEQQPFQSKVPELFMLLNVGLFFVDHIHFQYNGLLFGILLLSISYIFEDRYLRGAFTFAILLNFKHIFLYVAPAFAAHILRFYVLDKGSKKIERFIKLAVVGIIPFLFSFVPFYGHLLQVFHRLFPFKRGLTHAYWAPNFWALYNVVDRFLGKVFNVASETSTTSGLVQDFSHDVLPNIRPIHTFILTLIFMMPILLLIIFDKKTSQKHLMFLRAIIICALSSFMFGWHVHEKAILMALIPLSLTCWLDRREAKHALILGVYGYFSLFPLLFTPLLIVIRYSFYLSYMAIMYFQLQHTYGYSIKEDKHYKVHYTHGNIIKLSVLESLYTLGLVTIPLYEHLLSPLLGLDVKMPFLPLLLTSCYCGIGVTYIFFAYYYRALTARLAYFNPNKKNK